jgi:phosphoribosylformylglycinamidine synthase
MKQKYPDGDVIAPGTVIISAAAECARIKNVVSPVAQLDGGSIYYLDFSQDEFHLGGSSFAQSLNAVGTKTPSVTDANYFKIAFNSLQEFIKKGIIEAGHDIGSGGLITSLLEMCFPSTSIGMNLDFSSFKEGDLVKLLFSEKPAVVLQSKEDLTSLFAAHGIKVDLLGKVNSSKLLKINDLELDIAKMRTSWMATSMALEKKQTAGNLAEARLENVVKQPLKFKFPQSFQGMLPKLKSKKIKAAVLREKGSNSEREMAYAMDLSGFDVRDVHMTDLIEGREDLKDIQFLVAVGGFSNSDVLGSAKGWAGAIKYNTRAKEALTNFFNRPDTLSLGVCNGCQLFVELGLLTPEAKQQPKMLHNDSGKFECIFTAVRIQKSKSIMLQGLEGSTLGIWAAHGEGKFAFPEVESKYQIPAKYLYTDYPSNPNGSDFNAAMLSSQDGRHLVMMPHLERSTFPWNWAHYPKDKNDEVSPWILAFENAFSWLESSVK